MAIEIYSTCPQSKDIGAAEYLRAVADVARWSEEAGCTGILVYTDNGILDPWLVSQTIIDNTQRLHPLVAVQPLYMHPYAAANMVTSLAYLYGRSVHLNMLAGGFRNDLLALGDDTPHDDRYLRTVEYTRIMLDLLDGSAPVTFAGRYYRVENLRLTPAVEAALRPEVLMSGSSPAGLAAARELGATAVKYPRPPGEEEAWLAEATGGPFGVRVGIVARETSDEAWRVALERFPESRAGQITHKLAMAVSDSHWHRQLAGRADIEFDPESGEPIPYWLGPFHNYRTFCPYLVGSYEQVAELLAHYISVGSTTFILDIPPSAEELTHVQVVFDRAQQGVPA